MSFSLVPAGSGSGGPITNSAELWNERSQNTAQALLDLEGKGVEGVKKKHGKWTVSEDAVLLDAVNRLRAQYFPSLDAMLQCLFKLDGPEDAAATLGLANMSPEAREDALYDAMLDLSSSRRQGASAAQRLSLWRAICRELPLRDTSAIRARAHRLLYLKNERTSTQDLPAGFEVEVVRVVLQWARTVTGNKADSKPDVDDGTTPKAMRVSWQDVVQMAGWKKSFTIEHVRGKWKRLTQMRVLECLLELALAEELPRGPEAVYQRVQQLREEWNRLRLFHLTPETMAYPVEKLNRQVSLAACPYNLLNNPPVLGGLTPHGSNLVYRTPKTTLSNPNPKGRYSKNHHMDDSDRSDDETGLNSAEALAEKKKGDLGCLLGGTLTLQAVFTKRSGDATVCPESGEQLYVWRFDAFPMGVNSVGKADAKTVLASRVVEEVRKASGLEWPMINLPLRRVASILDVQENQVQRVYTACLWKYFFTPLGVSQELPTRLLITRILADPTIMRTEDITCRLTAPFDAHIYSVLTRWEGILRSCAGNEYREAKELVKREKTHQQYLKHNSLPAMQKFDKHFRFIINDAEKKWEVANYAKQDAEILRLCFHLSDNVKVGDPDNLLKATILERSKQPYMGGNVAELSLGTFVQAPFVNLPALKDDDLNSEYSHQSIRERKKNQKFNMQKTKQLQLQQQQSHQQFPMDEDDEEALAHADANADLATINAGKSNNPSTAAGVTTLSVHTGAPEDDVGSQAISSFFMQSNNGMQGKSSQPDSFNLSQYVPSDDILETSQFYKKLQKQNKKDKLHSVEDLYKSARKEDRKKLRGGADKLVLMTDMMQNMTGAGAAVVDSDSGSDSDAEGPQRKRSNTNNAKVFNKNLQNHLHLQHVSNAALQAQMHLQMQQMQMQMQMANNQNYMGAAQGYHHPAAGYGHPSQQYSMMYGNNYEGGVYQQQPYSQQQMQQMQLQQMQQMQQLQQMQHMQQMQQMQHANNQNNNNN